MHLVGAQVHQVDAWLHTLGAGGDFLDAVLHWERAEVHLAY